MRLRLVSISLTLVIFSVVLEKEIHSSTLAWKLPWTGEPGGLPSMGSHRVDMTEMTQQQQQQQCGILGCISKKVN